MGTSLSIFCANLGQQSVLKGRFGKGWRKAGEKLESGPMEDGIVGML